MNKLNELKVVAVGTIALLSLAAIAPGNAFAQNSQQSTPKTEQMSGCSCCKKMMEKKTNDGSNSMPGMNHSTPTSK